MLSKGRQTCRPLAAFSKILDTSACNDFLFYLKKISHERKAVLINKEFFGGNV